MNLNILYNTYTNLIQPIFPTEFATRVNVSSPLRVNFSAGWNDTPPYCNENEGFILTAPISYDNYLPVNVDIIKIDEPKIILSSTDTNASTEIVDILDLLNCVSPLIPFSLHKASILASGLIPINPSFNLSSFLKKIGGFKLTTNVKNIPIGSRTWHK